MTAKLKIFTVDCKALGFQVIPEKGKMMGTEQVKTPQSSLLFIKIEPVLLNEYSLDYYRPLVNFLSFERS